MRFSAKKISDLLNAEIIGDSETTISKFSKIEEADEDSICFYDDERYSSFLENLNAGILIIDKKLNIQTPDKVTVLRVDNPRLAVSTLLSFYDKKTDKEGIESNSYISISTKYGDKLYLASFAYISDNCKIGNNVKIYPHVYISDNVEIGNNTIIHSGVKVHHGTKIGNNCTLHSGSVIGGDGFGFASIKTGEYQKIPQVGIVILEDNVEIGSNTTIDRATMGATLIKSGTKLDNQIQIGHNVTIGRDTVIAAMSGIAGSTEVGDNVMIGGMSAIKGHIKIGNKAKINAFSGVWQNVDENKLVSGMPADDLKKTLRIYHHLKKLPELFRRVKNIEKKIT